MLRIGYLPCTQDPPSGAHMTRVIDEITAEAQMAEASGWAIALQAEEGSRVPEVVHTLAMMRR